ncbi:MAG: disulfide bond formation protein B [Gammaproteobacteria bacterium]|nr:disulfide bond formation protein B [Gammaproteobacteria bacterium]
MISLLTQRRIFAGVFLLAAALIAVALYMQHVMGLEPCPLCIVQRVLVMAVGAVALIAAVHDPAATGRRVYAGLLAVLAVLGAAVAGRHVWLQSLPPERVPECGPGLEYMLETFPLLETLEMVLRGSGECAAVSWRFMGLTIPGWTLVVFCALALLGLALVLTRFAPRAGRAR